MKLPTIGDLKRRVTIRRWADIPAMGTGIDQSFDAGVLAWAMIEPVGSAIFFGTKQVGEEVTHRIIIRRTTALTDRTLTGEHVVESEGVRYRVKRASDINDARRFVMLEVESLGLYLVNAAQARGNLGMAAQVTNV